MHAAIAAVALKSVKAEVTHKILLNGTNCPGAMCSLGVAPVTAGASSAVLVKALWARGGWHQAAATAALHIAVHDYD